MAHLVVARTMEMAGVSEDTAEVSADQMEDPGSGQAGDLVAGRVVTVHLDQMGADQGRRRHRRRHLARTMISW